MNLESITCGNCGGPLQVPAGVGFVTCNHCHTSLAVHRGESATYTEKIDQIDARTREIAGELAELRHETELARVDREWEQERQTYLVKNNDGHLVEPTAGGSVVVGVVTAIFGALWTMMVARSNGVFALFGVFFMVVGIGSAAYSYSKAGDLEEARRRYEDRRQKLSAKSFGSDPNAQGDDGDSRIQ